jgi:hypothetical protein
MVHSATEARQEGKATDLSHVPLACRSRDGISHALFPIRRWVLCNLCPAPSLSHLASLSMLVQWRIASHTFLRARFGTPLVHYLECIPLQRSDQPGRNRICGSAMLLRSPSTQLSSSWWSLPSDAFPLSSDRSCLPQACGSPDPMAHWAWPRGMPSSSRCAFPSIALERPSQDAMKTMNNR